MRGNMTSPCTKRKPVEKYSIGRKTCLLLLYGPEISCFTGVGVSFLAATIAGSLNLRERRTYISVEEGINTCLLVFGCLTGDSVDGSLVRVMTGESEMYRNYLTGYSDALIERRVRAFDLRFASRKNSSGV